MEYSKEDLMEAKKQIWGVGENMGTEESKGRNPSRICPVAFLGTVDSSM